MRRGLAAFLSVVLLFVMVIPVSAGSPDKLPPKLRQFAVDQSLTYVRTRTTSDGQVCYEFTRDGKLVIVSQAFVDLGLDKDGKTKKTEAGVEHYGAHASKWTAIDWLMAAYTIYCLCNEIYYYVDLYILKSGTGWEGTNYEYIAADIINGVVYWR